MKKLFCTVIAVMMMALCFAGCASAPKAEASSEIVVGMIGPYTGSTAVYGLAVKNGAQLYIDQVNAKGGINGKQVKVVAYDNKGDDGEAVNAFNRLVDQDGITALIGDVLTSNTIAVVGEAYPINMPMITASATAAAVTVTLGFRPSYVRAFSVNNLVSYEHFYGMSAGTSLDTAKAASEVVASSVALAEAVSTKGDASTRAACSTAAADGVSSAADISMAPTA